MRNDSIDNFRIELNKPSLRGSFYVRQGDTRARTIHITITDNGKIVDLSDAKICELLIKKPDNNQNDQTMVRVGNELQYTLRTQDINVAGECLCQVMVTFKDGTFLTTPTFSVMVYQKEVDQNLEKSTNEYTALSAIILDVEGTQAEINTYVDEKTNEITEIATTATTAATNASASATAASNSADDAEDQADAAARSASDCATYASNCAGLAANCASYLDDVTGIAATKINKVNGEAEGILNIKNGDVTFTDIVGNASNVVSTRASINDCNTKASNAVTTSNNALSKANQAYTFAYSANNNASTAKDISNRTKNKVNIVSGFVGSDIGYSNLPYTVQAGKILDQNGAVVNGSGRVLEMVVGSENVYIERVDLRIVPDGTDARSIAFYKADGTLIGEAEYYETFIDYDEYFSPISEYVKETTLPVPTNAKYLKIAASTSGQAKIFTQDNMSDAVKELQNRPSSITTTSTSPLPNCSASSIVGIDVDGCSTQNTNAIEQGAFSQYTDHSYSEAKFESATRIRLANVISVGSGSHTITCASGYKVFVVGLNASQKIISASGGGAWGTSVSISGCAYLGIALSKSDDSNITPSVWGSANVTIDSVVVNGTPTPTNPIAIVDASGDVTCRTEDNTQSNTITLPTLRSVGTVKDELIVNADGSGQIIKRIDVFTPTAISGFGTDANNGNYFSITTPSAIIADASNAIVMCNKLIGKSYNGRHADVNVSRIYRSATNNTNLLWIQMAKGDTTCTDEASALAFAKTLTIYYQLATPTTTTLTASEVSAIRQLQTYSGTTIIDSALDVKSVTYHADTKQYIDGRTDYSYSDTVIGKWADGKDLHRMVISATTPSSANTDTDLLTISNANIKRIDGIVTTSSGNEVPINYFYNTTYYIATWVKNGALRMRVGTLYNSAPCEIIVEYTLTDEATQSDDGIAVLSEGGDE